MIDLKFFLFRVSKIYARWGLILLENYSDPTTFIRDPKNGVEIDLARGINTKKPTVVKLLTWKLL